MSQPANAAEARPEGGDSASFDGVLSSQNDGIDDWADLYLSPVPKPVHLQGEADGPQGVTDPRAIRTVVFESLQDFRKDPLGILIYEEIIKPHINKTVKCFMDLKSAANDNVQKLDKLETMLKNREIPARLKLPEMTYTPPSAEVKLLAKQDTIVIEFNALLRERSTEFEKESLQGAIDMRKKISLENDKALSATGVTAASVLKEELTQVISPGSQIGNKTLIAAILDDARAQIRTELSKAMKARVTEEETARVALVIKQNASTKEAKDAAKRADKALAEALRNTSTTSLGSVVKELRASPEVIPDSSDEEKPLDLTTGTAKDRKRPSETPVAQSPAKKSKKRPAAKSNGNATVHSKPPATKNPKDDSNDKRGGGKALERDRTRTSPRRGDGASSSRTYGYSGGDSYGFPSRAWSRESSPARGAASSGSSRRGHSPPRGGTTRERSPPRGGSYLAAAKRDRSPDRREPRGRSPPKGNGRSPPRVDARKRT
mmetsp:Transcript_30778/g.77854  ORF Transcript_30778/g.77854 Transcript_30778/m.77854 type:complete len:490 (-) Transcript_30778:2335-3804(-)